MNGRTYDVAIRRKDAGPDEAQATVQVDFRDDRPVITHLEVSAPSGHGLTSASLYQKDLFRDLGVLLAGLQQTDPETSRAVAARSQPPRTTGTLAPVEPATPAVPDDNWRTRVAASSRRDENGRFRPSTKTSAKKAKNSRSATHSSQGDGKSQRTYRNMPAAGKVVKAWEDLGSAAKVGQRFGVPTYTARRWLQRVLQD